jgi:hypothetical protein
VTPRETATAVRQPAPALDADRVAAVSDTGERGSPPAPHPRLALRPPRVGGRSGAERGLLPLLEDATDQTPRRDAASVRPPHPPTHDRVPAPAHISRSEARPAPAAPTGTAAPSAGSAIAAPLPHPWPELRPAHAPVPEAPPTSLMARQLARARRLTDEQAAV